MKLSRRGMIRIRMPAIRATMAGRCPAVMVIRISPAVVRKIESRAAVYPLMKFRHQDARRANRFPQFTKFARKCRVYDGDFSGTSPSTMNWLDVHAGEGRRAAV